MNHQILGLYIVLVSSLLTTIAFQIPLPSSHIPECRHAPGSGLSPSLLLFSMITTIIFLNSSIPSAFPIIYFRRS